MHGPAKQICKTMNNEIKRKEQSQKRAKSNWLNEREQQHQQERAEKSILAFINVKKCRYVYTAEQQKRHKKEDSSIVCGQERKQGTLPKSNKMFLTNFQIRLNRTRKKKNNAMKRQ